MIAYVDASVILRLALRQANALVEWPKIQRGVSSTVTTTESLRSLDRLRLRAKLSDEEVATRRAAVLSLLASLELATHADALGVAAKAHGFSVVGLS